MDHCPNHDHINLCIGLVRTTVIPKGDLLRLLQHGIVMMGASAHAVEILGGHGDNMALFDAVNLADVLGEGSNIARVVAFDERICQQWQEVVGQSKKSLVKLH